MTEHRRPESLRASDPSAEPDVRAAQIEALLVEGLDAYFAGRHDEAMHVWTRVLFLDRSHARARAYIDRARTAIAERQRQSEELLEASQDLLDRGQTRAARNLLAEAVSAAGDDERASALRLRLERLERVLAASRHIEASNAAAQPEGKPVHVAGRTWPLWLRRAGMLGLLASVLVILTMTVTDSIGPRWVGFPSAENTMPHVAPAPLPVLSSADVALIRARTLYALGRLTEALRALDHIAVDSPSRPDADRLRAEIQRLLLAALSTGITPTRGGDAR